MAIRDIVPRRWRHDDDRAMTPFETQMASLHREMDRLFEDMWTGRENPFASMRKTFEFLPQVDETEDESAYTVRVDLPGMDENDVEITVSDRVLTIQGEKKSEDEEEGKDFYRRERSSGSFRRVLTLPGEVDQSGIAATFKKGVLNIRLPKSPEAREKTRRIPVSSAE